MTILRTVMLAGVIGGAAAGPSDAFRFLAPHIVLTDDEQRQLDNDGTFARVLQADGGQLAIFAATRLQTEPEALAQWTREIAALKRSRFVLAIGKFSNPPRLADAAGMSLDDADLDALRDCVVGDCGLKLTAHEISALSRAIREAGADWRESAQRQFRQLVIERVRLYRSSGLAAIAPIADRQPATRLDEVFGAIMRDSPYVARVPELASWLREHPDASSDDVESFFYWSKERFGAGKPVILVTHVGIARPDAADAPALLVAGKQLLATHYMYGALSLTGVLRDPGADANYFFYLNRSRIDLLDGFFGGLRRAIIERRLRSDTPEIIRGLRSRLESGPPK